MARAVVSARLSSLLRMIPLSASRRSISGATDGHGGVPGFGIAFSIPYRPRIVGAPPEPDPSTQTADRSAIPWARLHTGLAAVLPLPKRTWKRKMTRADLTEEVSRALDISRKESATLVVTMLDSIVRSLRSGDRVELRGFGSFGTRQRQSRIGRNPKTGACVEVPAKRIPYFK